MFAIVSLIIGGIVVVFATAAVVYFWNPIREFLNGPLRNFIGKVFGQNIGDRFSEFVAWLDDKATSVRKSMKNIFGWFQQNVIGVRSTHQRNGGYVREYAVRINDTQVQRYTEELMLDELPPDVREEMRKRGVDMVVDDEKRNIEDEYNRRMQILEQ